MGGIGECGDSRTLEPSYIVSGNSNMCSCLPEHLLLKFSIKCDNP